jgi:hypothetical protein
MHALIIIFVLIVVLVASTYLSAQRQRSKPRRWQIPWVSMMILLVAVVPVVLSASQPLLEKYRFSPLLIGAVLLGILCIWDYLIFRFVTPVSDRIWQRVLNRRPAGTASPKTKPVP